MWSWLSQNKSNDPNCNDIKNLSNLINANINTISGFIQDNGFLLQLQKDLANINISVKELKGSQNKLLLVNTQLSRSNPNYDKISEALKTENNTEIQNLKNEILRLNQMQAQPTASSQQISTQKDICKDVCTAILKSINDRLTSVVGSFNAYQQTINGLIREINQTLSPAVRDISSTVGLGSGNNIEVSNLGNTNPSGSSRNSSVSSLSDSGISANSEDIRSSTSSNSIDSDLDLGRVYNNSSPSSNTTDGYNPLISPLGGIVQPRELGNSPAATFNQNKRGGYYYPTSSSSKRNKKSIGRRKKHKRTNKTRR